MQFSTLAAALAFVASAYAQTAGFDPITKPETGEIIPAGSTYTITWQSTRDGKVSLSLIGGETPSTLVPLGEFATGIDSSAGKYNWAVDSSLGKDKTYGIKLTLESDTSVFQYSFPFNISASGSSGSSSTTGYPSGESSTSSAGPKSSSGSASSYPATTLSSYSVTTIRTVSSTYAPSGNLSTTHAPTVVPTTVTSYSTAPTTATSARSSTSASTVPTAAASRVVAGSLALVGGIAAAVFAL